MTLPGISIHRLRQEGIVGLALICLANFFLLTLVQRLVAIAGVDLHLPQIMRVVFGLGGAYCLSKIRIRAFDVLVFAYLLSMVLSALVAEDPHYSEYFKNGLFWHILPVFCYFIGRRYDVDLGVLLRNMRWPILVAMVFGLIFYFRPTAWYLAMKEAQTDEFNSDYAIQSIYRLSSFWGHPYYVSYATCLYLMALMAYALFGEQKRGYKESFLLYVTLGIGASVSVFAQLRATLSALILSYLYMSFMKTRSARDFLYASGAAVGIAALLVVGLSIVDDDTAGFIAQRTDEFFEEGRMIERFEHTGGGDVRATLLGDGLAYHGYEARRHGRWGIVDQEFQEHMAELGILGTGLLIAILAATLLRGFRHRMLVVENGVVGFFFIAMFAASVLSNHHQYNYIFWFTVGLLWNDGHCARITQSMNAWTGSASSR